MNNPQEILPGVIFYSYLSAERREKVCFWNHHTLVLQVSGQFRIETSDQTLSMTGGEMLLIRKNQLGTLTKTPLPGGNYETIVISLQEDLLRKIQLEEKLNAEGKYLGPPNVLVPINEFLKGYFQSIIPYARSSGTEMTAEMGVLKIKEGVKLLLLALPVLRNFLFDFSEPHKIDLEKFMLSNFHFNIPVEKFAQLTGRSLAAFKRDFQKTFGGPPRQWLQNKRLNTAKYLIETRNLKPSAVYLDLGFESLSHFSSSFKRKFGKTPTGLSYAFPALLEIIGINPYVQVPETILEKILDQAGKSKGHIPVSGTVNGVPYRQTLLRYSGMWRLYVNTAMLKDSPKRIGETLEVTIEFDPSDRTIPAHPDLTEALRNNPEAKARFDLLSPSAQKEIVRYIAQLKTPESRKRNIAKAISFLLGKGPFIGRRKL